MTKFTFSRISSMVNAPAAINGIIAQIESALDTLVSRDGVAPNQMLTSLDVNSNHILNLPAPVADQEPVRLQDISTLTPNTVTVADVLAALPDVHVNSIAALRTVTPDASRVITTTGYYTSGDGGGGHFHGVTGAAPGTYVDNGGTIIVPSGGNGSAAWLRQDIGVLSVRCFGAKGDGATDDAAAFQAALFSGSRLIVVPSGNYVIGSKLYIPAEVGLVGELTGIGGVSDTRGATLIAADSLTDFILENYSITASPSDPWWHGGRVDYIQFRGNAALKTASGFNPGPCGDGSSIRNCKFYGLDVGLKVGGSTSPFGVQVSCSIDGLSLYQSNVGLLFDTCRFTASVRNLMTDTCVKPVHFKDGGATFHCTVDQWHSENLAGSAEVFHVDNCDNSFIEIRSGAADATGASANLEIVNITRSTATNKARVKVANTYSTQNTNYILNDHDLGVSWTQAELGLSYGEIRHNLNQVLGSGQGSPIFGKSFSGTWTPVVADDASGGNQGTCTVVGAKYQRIGGMVFVQGNLTNIDTTGMTAGNALFIRGLPYASSSTFNRQVGSAVGSGIASGSIYACTVGNNVSALRLTKTANTDALVSDVTSGSGSVYFSIAYSVL
jgi:hypothetical protein